MSTPTPHPPPAIGALSRRGFLRRFGMLARSLGLAGLASGPWLAPCVRADPPPGSAFSSAFAPDAFL